MDTTELTKGNFLNSKTCQENDIIEIIGEGEMGEITDKATKKVRKVINLPVKVNDKEILIYTPAKKSLEKLQKIFATSDSSAWIGKKFLAHFIDMEMGGNELKVLRPKAIEAKA